LTTETTPLGRPGGGRGRVRRGDVGDEETRGGGRRKIRLDDPRKRRRRREGERRKYIIDAPAFSSNSTSMLEHPGSRSNTERNTAGVGVHVL
jgi:hypothetical protein